MEASQDAANALQSVLKKLRLQPVGDTQMMLDAEVGACTHKHITLRPKLVRHLHQTAVLSGLVMFVIGVEEW